MPRKFTNLNPILVEFNRCLAEQPKLDKWKFLDELAVKYNLSPVEEDWLMRQIQAHLARDREPPKEEQLDSDSQS